MDVWGSVYGLPLAILVLLGLIELGLLRCLFASMIRKTWRQVGAALAVPVVPFGNRMAGLLTGLEVR
jgi:hypothetical protein